MCHVAAWHALPRAVAQPPPRDVRVTRGRDSGVWRRGWVPGSLGRPRLGLKSAHPLLLALLRALEALGLPGPARSLPLLARLVRVGVEG